MLPTTILGTRNTAMNKKAKAKQNKTKTKPNQKKKKTEREVDTLIGSRNVEKNHINPNSIPP